MTSDEPVVLTDPREVRALAHPARMAVIEELYGGKELTATECAEVAGLSPSAMSYHLRSLERSGIVERAAPTGDGRERPYRAAGAYVRVDSEIMRDSTTVASALTSTLISRLAEQFQRWNSSRRSEPREWRDAVIMTNAQVWLLPEELAEIDEYIDGVIEKYRGRRADARPAGARRVRVNVYGFPADAPPKRETTRK